MATHGSLVLVVDDDPVIARSLEELLGTEFEVQSLTSSRAALEFIGQREIGVVLADQRMPELDGIELLMEARRLQPTLVGVLITAHAEVDSAVRAINAAGVLGFLTKPWDEAELLLVIRRALQAHAALRKLSRASHAPQDELRLFERFAAAGPVPTTARGFGAEPLRQSAAEQFAELAARYTEILALALDERAYTVDHRVSQALHELGDSLGALRAGPRDVVDLHVTALKQRLSDANADEGWALTEEARLLVLELMGDVLAYYRSYTLGVHA